MILGFYEITGKAQALLGWWPHCSGSKPPAAGHPGHGAVGIVCDQCVAFCHPPFWFLLRLYRGIGGGCSSEMTFSIKQKTFSSLIDDWSVNGFWDWRQ